MPWSKGEIVVTCRKRRLEKFEPVKKRKHIVRRPRGEKPTWYFVRLAFLAIPWESKDNENPRGTLLKHYHLIQAKNMKSAFNKASHILSMSEHCEGDGRLRDKRVIFKKIGVLNLEPLYERL